jgi:Carboxypeptidase regulatory-like domain
MKRVLLPLLACMLIGAPAAAQSDRGRLIGTIYDASGAVVPNASVSVVNQSTGAARRVSSDEKGNYRFEDLLPAA